MARRSARNTDEQVSMSDLLIGLSKRLEQQAKKPNIFGYEPHDKQRWFHTLPIKRKLYIGGNRSGKSYGAVAEDIWWASGTHPFIEIPDEQIRGRVVGVDYERGVEKILIPIFKSLCPPSLLKGGSWETAWKAKERALYFAYNDSYIEFMSYEQSTEKFAGTSRHFIHYDEEPPINVFNECNARLVDTNGSWWISMTPVEGMTWLYDKIYQPAEESDDKEILLVGNGAIGPVWKAVIPGGPIAVIEVGMNENPHLSEEAREAYLSSLDADERSARSKGHFVQTAGKVFKSFTVETHVSEEDFDPTAAQKKGWQIYTSVDHGWNAPTAWLWHAVAPEPDGRVLTFAEHYKSEMTIEEHAHVVTQMEMEWGLNREDIMRTGDPAMHQHSGHTGTTVIQEYAKHGLYIYTDSIPIDRGIGVGRMQMYFRLRQTAEGEFRPQWMVSNSCPNFIKELKNLRFAVYTSKKIRYDNNPQEKVHKKDDHAFDSAKYFATFLPELAPDAYIDSSRKPVQAGMMTYDEALIQARSQAADEGPKWTVIETYV